MRAWAWIKQASEVCVKQTSQVLVKKQWYSSGGTKTLRVSYVKLTGILADLCEISWRLKSAFLEVEWNFSEHFTLHKNV